MSYSADTGCSEFEDLSCEGLKDPKLAEWPSFSGLESDYANDQEEIEFYSVTESKPGIQINEAIDEENDDKWIKADKEDVLDIRETR